MGAQYDPEIKFPYLRDKNIFLAHIFFYDER
jgi:hypothetical protein